MSETLSKPTLPTFSWIGHLKEDDRELLSSYGEFFPGHPGNVIIAEGAMQTQVFVVISGKLEVRAKQDDGTEILLALVGPGETLGEISLFNPGPAAATVTAVEFSQLWRIADSDLIHFMDENPGAGNILLRTLASILAQRLRQMNPRAFGLSAYAVIDSPELPPAPAAPAPEPATSELTATTEEGEKLPAAILLSSSGPLPKEKRAPALPVNDVSASYQDKSVNRKTQIVPNIDELEPL